jgi:pimeloyl-ACP methyl ester carboxylesterase
MAHQTPLLLLPGLMNDARVWKPIQDALSSERKVSVSQTHLADAISPLAASAIDSMPPGKFAVAGFSLGGYVALEACRQAPGRIAGIALLDTGARADSDDAKQGRQDMVDALKSGKANFAQVAGSFASRLLHASHASDKVLLELLGDMARNIGADGFSRQQTAAMSRTDSRDLLKTLHCPALVLCGEEDRVTPPALAEEIAALLPGDVDLVRVPQCGHMSTLEQPVVVVTAFMRWLGRVDSHSAVK